MDNSMFFFLFTMFSFLYFHICLLIQGVRPGTWVLKYWSIVSFFWTTTVFYKEVGFLFNTVWLLVSKYIFWIPRGRGPLITGKALLDKHRRNCVYVTCSLCLLEKSDSTMWGRKFLGRERCAENNDGVLRICSKLGFFSL